jgi:DNA-binding MarR family transcriptional regulator
VWSSPHLKRNSLDAVGIDLDGQWKVKTDYLTAELNRLERRNYIPLEKVQEVGEKMEAFITDEMKTYEEKLREQQEQRRHSGSCGGNFQIVDQVQRRQQELILKVTTLETILFALPKFLKEINE